MVNIKWIFIIKYYFLLYSDLQQYQPQTNKYHASDEI